MPAERTQERLMAVGALLMLAGSLMSSYIVISGNGDAPMTVFSWVSVGLLFGPFFAWIAAAYLWMLGKLVVWIARTLLTGPRKSVDPSAIRRMESDLLDREANAS